MTTLGKNDTTKYNDIKVGDYIIKYNQHQEYLPIVGNAGYIAKIKKLNGNTMVVTLDNGRESVITRYHATSYDLYPCPPVTEGN